MTLIGLFFHLYSHDGETLDDQDLLALCKELGWLLGQFNGGDDTLAWTTITNLIAHSLEQSRVVRGNSETDITDVTQQLSQLQLIPITNNHDDKDGNSTTKGNNIRQRMKQLDDVLFTKAKDIGNNDGSTPSSLCELSLASFRMVVLTNEELEMFFDHQFQDSFKLEKPSAVEQQKSLGRELFENLFAEGKSLAKAPHHRHHPHLPHHLLHHRESNASTPSSTTTTTSSASPTSSLPPTDVSPSGSASDVPAASSVQGSSAGNTKDNNNEENMSEQVDHLFNELGHQDVEDGEPYVLV